MVDARKTSSWWISTRTAPHRRRPTTRWWPPGWRSPRYARPEHERRRWRRADGASTPWPGTSRRARAASCRYQRRGSLRSSHALADGDHQGADRRWRLRQYQPADRLRHRRESGSGAGDPGRARRAGDGCRGDHDCHRHPCDDWRHGHAPADCHDHGARRSRQDQTARRYPRDESRGRRGGRHHPAHRRVSGRGAGAEDLLPRYPRPRGVHRHAGPWRARDRYRGARCRRG